MRQANTRREPIRGYPSSGTAGRESGREAQTGGNGRIKQGGILTGLDTGSQKTRRRWREGHEDKSGAAEAREVIDG